MRVITYIAVFTSRRPTVGVGGNGAGLRLPVETGHCLGVNKTQFSGANPHRPLHAVLGRFLPTKRWLITKAQARKKNLRQIT